MHNNTEPSTDWGVIPVPDDVVDEVTSEAGGANQGPIVPALNALQARTGWLRDAHKGVRAMKSVVVKPGATEGSTTVPVNGLQVDFSGGRFISATIEVTEPEIRVFGSAENTSLRDAGIASSWGLDASSSGVSFTGSAGESTMSPTGFLIEDAAAPRQGVLTASSVDLYVSGVPRASLSVDALQFVTVTNPGRTVDSANKIRPALACKAWGVILAANDAIGTQDGEGGWTASIVTSGGKRRVRVTLNTALQNTVYVVNVDPANASGDFSTLEDYSNRSTTTFDLVFKDAGTEREASSASGIGFQFTLFGRRT